MKNGFITGAMWTLFAPSFQKQLTVLGVSDGKAVMEKAREKYKAIIRSIPPFGKNDILLVNLISAAEVAAIYLSLDKKPSCEQMKQYYGTAMDESLVMRLFLKRTDYYSVNNQKKLARQAELSQLSDNPYSWKFKFFSGETLDAFDAIFDRCGICHLFAELGMSEITPAMCAYDCGMAKWTKTVFTREYTLVSSGPVCDCHYRRRKS